MNPRLLPLAVSFCALLAAPVAAQQEWGIAQNRQSATAAVEFGSAVAGVGDVDGDGNDDYVVGAWTDDAGSINAGSFTLFSGATGGSNSLAVQTGTELASKLGWRVVALGEHDSDGLLKFAVSAPFHSGPAGPLSGQVQLVYWDTLGGALAGFDTLDGIAPGDLFGGGLAAFDYDNDGDLDLAVGAVGAGTMDGRIDIFALDSVSAGGSPVKTILGTASASELFGFSLDTAGLNGGTGEDLLVGIPLADGTANREGAAEVWDVSAVTPTGATLVNPFAGTANAHFGWSVSGTHDLNDDAAHELVVGAPDTTNGGAGVFNGADLVLLEQHDGEAAGDRFGFSVLCIDDANFDPQSVGDYVIGAPGFNAGNGKIYVRTLRPASILLFEAETPSASKAGFGFSLGQAGDINQNGKTELLVGAPLTDTRDGFVIAYRPPVDEPDTIDLTASGSFEWETDVTLDVVNLDTSAAPSTLYWYYGDNAGPSVTPEGFTVDIGNPVLFATTINAGTGSAQELFRIPETLSPGIAVVFQMVEDRGLDFVRVSTPDGAQVINPGPTLFLNGERGDNIQLWSLPVGSTFDLETRWGLPNSIVYFYWGVDGRSGSANVQAPQSNNQDPWFVTLLNPQITYGFVISDANGVAVLPPQTPDPAWTAAPTGFEAFDWDIFIENRALTPLVAVQFQ